MVPVTHRSAGRTRLAGGVVNHTHTLTPESSHEAVSGAQGAHRSGLGLFVSIRLKILQRFLDLLLSFSSYPTLNDAFKVIGCFLWHRAVTFDAPLLSGFSSFLKTHLVSPLVVSERHAPRAPLGVGYMSAHALSSSERIHSTLAFVCRSRRLPQIPTVSRLLSQSV
tara:strand:- start:558 stop:1055 length:498 start_codon:yes stop_codon:yes gene_type:complete